MSMFRLFSLSGQRLFRQERGTSGATCASPAEDECHQLPSYHGWRAGRAVVTWFHSTFVFAFRQHNGASLDCPAKDNLGRRYGAVIIRMVDHRKTKGIDLEANMPSTKYLSHHRIFSARSEGDRDASPLDWLQE